MARAPRSLIPKTSGQGVSRYSYQHAYSLGQRGSGGGPLPKIPPLKLDRDLYPKQQRGAKGAKHKEDTPPFNVSYGSTWGDGSI